MGVDTAAVDAQLVRSNQGLLLACIRRSSAHVSLRYLSFFLS